MRTLLDYSGGSRNGTGISCPPLTKWTDKDDSVGCKYDNWAYAIFAIVAFIIVGIPFIAFICYVQRKIRNKQRARRASAGRSSPYPYQPISSEGSGHANYGATDSSVDERVIRSPSHDSVSTASLADRQSQHQDTTSVASSRASMIPTYDEVSLNHRNAVAGKSRHPSNSEALGDTTKHPAGQVNQRRSSRLSADSQDRFVDQPGQFYDSVDVVSNLPKLQDQTKPKNDKQPPAKPPRQFTSEANTVATEDHVYSEVEGSEFNSAFQSPSNDVIYEISPKEDGSSAGAGEEGSSPVYAVLDPSPEVPDQNEGPIKYNDDEQREGLPSEQKRSLLHEEKPAGAEAAPSSSPDNKYLTLPPTPPKQIDEPTSENSALLASGSHEFDQYSVSPKDETSKSRTECEEFLLGKVRALPADRRNGTFLIRDSTSSFGSKVLTMYCWKNDSNKELYNFKISLTEDGQAFLNKSSKRFSDLNELLKDLTERKDMLPCVLTKQVFP